MPTPCRSVSQRFASGVSTPASGLPWRFQANERPGPWPDCSASLLVSWSDVNRVCLPNASAATWSAEIELEKLLPGTASGRGRPARERKRTASPFLRFLGILTWMAVSVRQLVRLLEDDGWVEVRQRGSHRQFRHPTKSGTVTVAGQESADVPPGTLNSVLKQAGLKNQRQQKKEGES